MAAAYNLGPAGLQAPPMLSRHEGVNDSRAGNTHGEGRAAAIEAAARCLAAGGLVAFPTETVYGLGADATNGPAVARLYEAKGRPAFNPLIAHVRISWQQVLGPLSMPRRPGWPKRFGRGP